MKHCPACRTDYHPRFDECFTCGAALEEGSIEQPSGGRAAAPGDADGAMAGDAPAAAVPDEEGARRALARAKEFALWGSLAALLVIGVLWATDPTVEVTPLGAAAVPLNGQEPLPPGGVVRTEVERQAVASTHELQLPALPSGTMYVYFPVRSETSQARHLPAIRAARHHEGAIVVSVGVSDRGSPVLGRMMEQLSRNLAKNTEGSRLPEAYQIVAVARFPLQAAPVRFSVSQDLEALLGEDSLQQVGLDLSESMIMGFYGQLAWYVVFGFAGLAVFVWFVTRPSR